MTRVRAQTISLVPSATETLLQWGVEPIAVTRFCEQGDRFPTVGGTKNPDVDAIVKLRPDVVIVCDQENRREDFDALVSAGVHVHVIHLTALSHVVPEMRGLAEAIGLPNPQSLASRCASPDRPAPRRRRRAFVPIWRWPYMTLNGSTYAMSLLAAVGIDGVANDDEASYPELDLAEAASRRADVVLAPNEPYEFTERHRPELEAVGPVEFVDGKDLFWWGTRTPGAFARLSELANRLPSRG